MLYLFGEPVVSLITTIHNNIINIVLAAEIATILENQKLVATKAIAGFEVRIVK